MLLRGYTAKRKKKGRKEDVLCMILNTKELSTLRAIEREKKSKKMDEAELHEPSVPLGKPVIYYNDEEYY